MQALGLVWGDMDCCAPDYRHTRTVLGAPEHPGAKQTLHIWRARMAKGGFVVGQDIPSRELAGVLRNLAVYEPVEDGHDYRVRIAGTAFYRRFGREVTGRLLSELFDLQLFADIRKGLLEVVGHGTPYSVAIERSQGARPAVQSEILLLPVASPDGQARWALAGMFFYDWAS